MTEHDEWEPWIEHDGRGCPCKGMYAQVKLSHSFYNPDINAWVNCDEGIVRGGRNWLWAIKVPLGPKIIRYRVRNPRALQQLRDLVENLPADARQDA